MGTIQRKRISRTILKKEKTPIKIFLPSRKPAKLNFATNSQIRTVPGQAYSFHWPSGATDAPSATPDAIENIIQE
jgi:hypothetical protein